MPRIPKNVGTSLLLEKVQEYIGPPKQGKVRDNFDLGSYLLMVATRRISVFDIVVDTINFKGEVLTAMSAYTFTQLLANFGHHLVAYGHEIDQYLPKELHNDSVLQRTAMVVKKRDVVPIEGIARGYLTGSGWKDYWATGEVCGIRLPKNLRDGDKLPEPIFTPSTKAEEGHDQNITEQQAADLVGWDTVKLVKDRTLALYAIGAAHAESVGLVLADTKSEWSHDGMLLDEVLTPDCSRFWSEKARLQALAQGKTPPSHDKQFVRDYCDQAGVKRMTNDEIDDFRLPEEIRDRTTAIYVETAGVWIGKELSVYQVLDMGVA